MSRAKAGDWTKPAAMAIPKEGYFELEQGRYVAKISAVLSELEQEASQELEATKIRGDKFKDGRASRELDHGVELQVSGGEFGLRMMIDASLAEDK